MSRASGPRGALVLRSALALAVSAAALWVVKEAVVITAADWRSSPVRLQATRWATGEQRWDEAQWQQALADLQAAIVRTPDDATLHEHLALLYTVKGRAQWGDGQADSPGIALYRQALRSQQEAVRLRPLQANSWANLALMRYAVNDTVEAVYEAWMRALKLGPNEPEVKGTLEAIVTLSWDVAPQEALDWLETAKPGTLTRLRAAQGATSASSAPASAAH